MDTTYVDSALDRLLAAPLPTDAVLTAAALLQMLRRRRENQGDSPWDRADGFAANGRSQNRFALRTADGDTRIVDLRGSAGRYEVDCNGRPLAVSGVTRQDHWLEVMLDDEVVRLWADAAGELMQISEGLTTHEVVSEPLYPVELDQDDESHPGSPMPGRIVEIYVEAGQRVAAGDPLLVLEGMKMEFTVAARRSGTVEQVLFRQGDLVDAEVPLVDLIPDEKGIEEELT
jgi:acetyl/propionyl-CoA carboxylase alpha subunit